MATYAADTTVDATKSRYEIEHTVERFGASDFAYATSGGMAMVGFVLEGRQIRFVLTLPDRSAPEFTEYKQGASTYLRTESAAQKLYDQALRQKWRALALLVKAKLASVEAGIATIEQEFLANVILPNGKTVYENVRGGVEQAYLTGKVPPMLALGGGSDA